MEGGEVTDQPSKTKRTYKCALCGEQVTLYVNPSAPPTHPCKKQSNRTTEMAEVK